MSGNPVDDYLNNLRNTSEHLGQQKIRTLAVQFNDTLLQFPALMAEVDFMLSQGAGVDYDTLAGQLELALNKATGLLLELDMLPVALRNAEVMRNFVDMMPTALKTRTADMLERKFFELRGQVEKALAQEKARQEAEAKAKAEAAAQEKARQEAEAIAKAEAAAQEKARQEAEVRAKAKAAAQEQDRRERWLTYQNMVEQEYILIKGSSEIDDLYFARYAVTNKRYRMFIDYLNGKNPDFEERYPRKRFMEIMAWFASNKVWDSNYQFGVHLQARQGVSAGRFCSDYHDDNTFGGDEQPVVKVSWYYAKAYCLWMSLIESQGEKRDLFRLPTEKEWVWAAGRKGGRKYPWGSEDANYSRANYGKHVGTTTSVGSYANGATPEGLYDMAGNVFEWCEDWYDSEKKLSRVLHGGSWFSNPDYLLCSARSYNHPETGDDSIGFRVVRSCQF